MKFHYAGKFDGDDNNLPKREHEPGAVQFKEPDGIKKISYIGMIASILLFCILLAISYFITDNIVLGFIVGNIKSGLLLIILIIIFFFFKIFLHTMFFKRDIYIYSWKGTFFILGQEDFSKARFCLMNLVPNIILGFIPFIIYLLNPSLEILGGLGAIITSTGIGDYINVFNALTQMPKGARTYLSGSHSYWYLPKK